MSLPSSSFDRSVLPSRPVPWISSQKNQAAAPLTDGNGKKLLDASRLIGMTRVGSAVVSPNGKSAVVEVQERCEASYSFGKGQGLGKPPS